MDEHYCVLAARKQETAPGRVPLSECCHAAAAEASIARQAVLSVVVFYSFFPLT